MRVDVCRGGKVAVSQPFLDLLHRHAVGQHQRSAAVSQIMEADVPQAVGLQQLRKAGRDIVWLEDCTNFVDADIAQIVFGHHRTIVSAAFAQSFAPSVQL